MSSQRSQKRQDSPQKLSQIQENSNQIKEEVHNDSNKESVQEEQTQQPGGIYKLFDLMRTDLGQQQADEMRQFYEKMSSQIKEICMDKSSSGGENSKGCQNSRSNIDSDGQNNDTTSLKQSLLLSLLQFQSKQLLVSQQEQNKQEDEEESKREVQSSERQETEEQQSETLKAEEPDVQKLFEDHQRVKIFLKPGKKKIANYLKDKSQNNIDPRVVIETRAGKPLFELSQEIAEKLFKEDPARLILKVGEKVYSQRSEKSIKVRDLMLADENVLGQALQQAEEKSMKVAEFEDLKLKAVYSLQLTNEESSDMRNHFKIPKKKEKIEIPEDLTETELMEMLTEVMSIMLINREEKMNQTGQTGGIQSLASFDPKAKLVAPSMLNNRKRKRQKTGQDLQKNSEIDDQDQKSNENQSGEKRASEEEIDDAKQDQSTISHKSRKKTLNERMQDYQQQLKRREAKEVEKYAFRVQKLFQKEQKKVKDRINAWYNGTELPKEENQQENEQFNVSSQFESTVDKINFKANPFFSSLIKLD